MKVVIDISKDDYDDIKKNGSCKNHGVCKCRILDAIADGTPLPKNPTNGDMIKALFPYVNVKDSSAMYYSVNIEDLSSDEELNTVGFRKDWWNAPYMAGGEE